MREYLRWRSERPDPTKHQEDWVTQYYFWIESRPVDATQTVFLIYFFIVMTLTLSAAFLRALP